jgi:hypothetical protein
MEIVNQNQDPTTEMAGAVLRILDKGYQRNTLRQIAEYVNNGAERNYGTPQAIAFGQALASSLQVTCTELAKQPDPARISDGPRLQSPTDQFDFFHKETLRDYQLIASGRQLAVCAAIAGTIGVDRGAETLWLAERFGAVATGNFNEFDELRWHEAVAIAAKLAVAGWKAALKVAHSTAIDTLALRMAEFTSVSDGVIWLASIDGPTTDEAVAMVAFSDAVHERLERHQIELAELDAKLRKGGSNDQR